MSGFSGINAFVNLTKVNYKELVEKYDANKDGELSTEEFQTALKEEKLDQIDISSINTNGDNKIDENEMAVYEQKYKMQTAVNNMSKDITKDFSGTKSQYIAQVTLELTNYITDFAENYKEDVSGMAEAFEKTLPTKYAEIKKNVLANDPSTFKSQVLDDMIRGLNSADTETRGTGEEAVSETAQKKIGQALETEANKYIKANPKCTQEELKAHLEAFMNETDAAKMQEAADAFKTKASTFGTYIDSEELTQLKEYAKDFLTEAVNKGVTVKLSSKNIATAAAITSALKGYSDGSTLIKDMETAIASLSTVSKKDSIIAADQAEQESAAQKNFTATKGDSYKINASLIDYSEIDGYVENKEQRTSGKHTQAYLKDRLIERNESTFTNLKAQFKEQITKMLQEKCISFDKIETIFENVFNTTKTEVCDASINTRNKTAFRSGYAKFNTKDLVDNFVNTFNTNIAKAIDEMNASDKDFDTIDLDFTEAGKDENGNAITDEATGKDLSQLYADGSSITQEGLSTGYSEIADQMVTRMKSQMLTKAKAMCTANGVTFDESAFTTIFNNAKVVAKNDSITNTRLIYSLEIRSTLNTRTLLDTFAEQFKTNYTAWVEEQAKKTAKK